MFNKLTEYKEIFLSLFKLALPILGGNISQLLIGITDAAVAGHYSTTALGAISVASAIVASTTVAAIGFIISVSIVIANLRGQGKPAKKLFKSTILFSILVSLPFFILLEILLVNINVISLSPELVEPVKQYIGICAWSLFPMAIFTALKEFLQAYEKVVFTNIVMFLTVFINLVLDIVLTFGGNFAGINIPALGVIGLSISTLLTRIASCIILLIYCRSLFKNKFVFALDYIKELFKVGSPIACSIFFEFLGFNLTAVLIGKFSAMLTAVHSILLNIANVTFIIVLSIANAASVKISFFKGKKEIDNIIKYSLSNIFIVMSVCIVTFGIIFNWSDKIISIFSNDPQIFILTKQMLKIAMFFLFFDGIQGACVGILKGLKDTKIIMFATILGYMFVGVPIGCYLAYCQNLVLQGFWLGLAIAIITIAIITMTKVTINLKHLKNIDALS